MKKVFSVFLLGSLFLILASCGSTSRRSFVRIVNASPDAGNIDVSINGTKLLSAYAYANGSNYFTIAPGSNIKFQVNQSGQTAKVIDTQITLVDKAYYTISVVGLVGSTTAVPPIPATITFLQTADDHATPAAGQVKFRVLHADPKFPEAGGGPSAVDVYVTTPGIPLNGTQPNFLGVPFQMLAPVVSLKVPTDVSTTSGKLEVRVAPTGTNPDVNSIPGWDSQSVIYTAGQIRTIVLLNNPTGTPFANQLLILKDLN